MANHPNWHDQHGQYPGPILSRHHPSMDPYAAPSPSAHQQHSYSNQPPHLGNYPPAHPPPPVSRQPQTQTWLPSTTSHDFGAPSPSNSNPRSSAPYPPAFDSSPSNMASNNTPIRQHANHAPTSASAYTSQSPYTSSDPQMHPTARPPQYEYSAPHAPPSGYPHPHHPSAQSHNPPPPQPPLSQHPSHPSHQHWNNHTASAPAATATTHLPSVLQPQSLAPSSGLASVRVTSAAVPSGLSIDRPFSASAPLKPEDEIDDDDLGGYDDYDLKGKTRAIEATHTTTKATSDFVKKLFSMLDDKAYDSIVAWSPSGESFIVKDMNDFTKHVLPRNFRHSNFASFVRQLNKYDFHKVKNPDDTPAAVGEHVWEFQHPDFVRGREDLLENVKRKIPAKKKSNFKAGLPDADRDDSPSMPLPGLDTLDKSAESYADLRAHVAHLTSVQDQMQNHILALTKQYQGVIGEMLTFQRNMVQQDQLMQNLIQYLINLEQDRSNDAALNPPASASAFLSHSAAQPGSSASNDASSFLPPGAPSSYADTSFNVAASAHPSNHNSSSLKAAIPPPHSASSSGPSADSATHAASSARMSGITTAPSTAAPLSPKSVASPMESVRTPESSQQLNNMGMHPPRLDDMGRRNSSLSSLRMVNNAPSSDPAHSSNATGASNSSSSNSSTNMPNLAESRNPTYDTSRRPDPTPSQSASVDPNNTSSDPNSPGDIDPSTNHSNKSGRRRRPTLVPGWTAPPRVLLVDDDQVCRRLSSKFLQVFGCSIDYAVDGMTAVNKMNQEKYDLVLMDIVMPNLDGISATSLIRQFDSNTPIISMTSNSGPSELINYMSSGMTDILPKPFTKEGLLNMLEKHLLHLKAAQREHRAASTDHGASGASGVAHTSPAGATGVAGAAASAGASASAIKRSTSPLGSSNHVSTDATSNTDTAGDDGVNPLAGMGFTDEEYVAMLQNLIAAGTGDDELASALFGNNETFTPQDNTPSRSGGDMSHTPNHITDNGNAKNSPFGATTPASGGGSAGSKRSAPSADDAMHAPMRTPHAGMPHQHGASDAHKRGRF